MQFLKFRLGPLLLLATLVPALIWSLLQQHSLQQVVEDQKNQIGFHRIRRQEAENRDRVYGGGAANARAKDIAMKLNQEFKIKWLDQKSEGGKAAEKAALAEKAKTSEGSW